MSLMALHVSRHPKLHGTLSPTAPQVSQHPKSHGMPSPVASQVPQHPKSHKILSIIPSPMAHQQHLKSHSILCLLPCCSAGQPSSGMCCPNQVDCPGCRRTKGQQVPGRDDAGSTWRWPLRVPPMQQGSVPAWHLQLPCWVLSTSSTVAAQEHPEDWDPQTGEPEIPQLHHSSPRPCSPQSLQPCTSSGPPSIPVPHGTTRGENPKS